MTSGARDAPDSRDTEMYRRVRGWLKDADTVFVSFPKSGRTWVRYFLQRYLELAEGVPFDLRPRSVPRTASSPSIVWTEDYFDVAFDIPGTPEILFADVIRERDLIVLIRDPRDTIVSLYYWITEREGKQAVPPPSEIREFVRSEVYGIERMAVFTLKLLEFFEEHKGPKLLLRYEALWTNPRREFRRLLRRVLQERRHGRAFRMAFKDSQFEAMQQFEMNISREDRVHEFQRLGVPDWRGDVNALKVRRGGVGRFSEELPELSSRAGLAEFPRTLELLDQLRAKYQPDYTVGA